MSGSSQKFIARNRAPRVQIEYDVELYGAEKKVQLPFVMGVMSDLSGKSKEGPLQCELVSDSSPVLALIIHRVRSD
ncbi:MAG: type VI secretion system contractile sheath small subunit, partial [Pseudomonadota bacterium]